MQSIINIYYNKKKKYITIQLNIKKMLYLFHTNYLNLTNNKEIWVIINSRNFL